VRKKSFKCAFRIKIERILITLCTTCVFDLESS